MKIIHPNQIIKVRCKFELHTKALFPPREPETFSSRIYFLRNEKTSLNSLFHRGLKPHEDGQIRSPAYKKACCKVAYHFLVQLYNNNVSKMMFFFLQHSG